MRNLKRVLTLVMAVAMMMSLLVVGAGAAFPDQDKIENKTAVNMNVALGIIKGRDTGDFDPTGNVTRAEMAKMIAVALNGGKEPTLGTKATPSFKDIKGHWAEGFIEYCAALNIVAGMGDGTFNPNGNVTATQASKMMLVSLGYDADTEGFNGVTWAVKINVVASQNDLYKDLAVDPNAALNRDNAAQLIWNGLNAKMVKYEYSLTSVNGVLQNIKVAGEYNDSRTMLSNKYNQADYDGRLTNFVYNSTKKEWTYTVANATATPNSMTFTTKDDFTKLYGQNVNVIYKLDGNKVDSVFGIYADDCSVLFSGVVNDLTIKTDSIKFDGTTYDFDNDTAAATKAHAFVYNTGFNLSGGNATALNVLSADQMTYSFDAVDYDDDGEVDFLVIYPYTVKEVTYAGSKTVTAGTSYTIADCDVYSGIAKDDYTKITDKANTATNTTRLDAVDKMVDGKVSSRSGSDYTIDGNVYALAAGVTMAVGDTVKDAAVVNGFIFAADTSGTTAIEDYAIVLGTETGAYGTTARLLFTDGTKKVVDTDQEYPGLKFMAVTYEINSDKDYELTAVNFNSTTGTGFDKAVASGATIDGTASSSKVKYIGGCNIADDAVIFVRDTKGTPSTADDTFEVITGSKLMGISKNNLSTNGAFADKTSSSGFNTVKVAYINTTATLVTADQHYGYAVKANGEVKNSDNKTVYSYTLWNGTEEVTVLGKVGLSTAVAKGNVVKYTLNSDGYVDTITPYATTGATPAAEVVAISAYDGTFIQLNGAATRYEIDKDDTTIIYIDNVDQKGVAGGAIQVADKATDGSYISNAIVLVSSLDVDLIVMDTRNDMTSAITAVANADADTQAKLTALFNSNNTVIVAGNYSPTEAITIPAGKTLSVTGDLIAGASNVTKADATATVVVTGAVTATSATVQVNSVGSVTTTGAATITATGTVGTVTANAAGATINATGAITTVSANAGTINASGNITTVTANAGTINVKDNLTIGTLTANAGTIAIDAGKTLTVTNAAGLALEKVVGVATATLILSNDSNATAAVSAAGAALKFWATAGDVITIGTTAVTAGVVDSDTYTWKTVYTDGLGANTTAWCK